MPLSLSLSLPAAMSERLGERRELLLSRSSRGASPERLANFSSRPASLAPLSPTETAYLELVEMAVTGSLFDEAGEWHPDRPLRLPQNRHVNENAGTCFVANT